MTMPVRYALNNGIAADEYIDRHNCRKHSNRGNYVVREAPAMTVRRNLGELLNEVQYRGDSVVITKGGKPVAAIVDIALYERIRRMRDDFDRMLDELAEAGKKMPESQVASLVSEAVEVSRRKVRASRKAKSRKR
jgi:prevent-host-death family protein